MNKTKKMALTILAATSLLFATTSFADGKDCDRGDRHGKHGYEKKCGNGEYKKYRNCKKGKNYHKGDKTRFIIGAVYSLDLTKEQETKIDEYVTEYRKNKRKTFDAFSEDGFDKEAFIKARMNKKENMIKAKADLIEKVYTVLTKEQKAELSKKLKEFKKMRKSRG